jgi:hypothetical protein
VKAARFLPPLLACATLVLLGANALPTVQRKHLLQRERARLLRELEQEEREAARLRAEVEALAHDPFYLERMLVETWNAMPEGAVLFQPFVAGHSPAPRGPPFRNVPLD